MELIIVLAIVGMIIAYLVMQRRKELKAESTPVTDVPVETKVEEPVAVPKTVVEDAPVVATAEVAAPVIVDEFVSEKPAPKARKPRKPKAVVADDSAVAAVKKPRKPRSKQV